MNKIPFEDGTKTQEAYVTIDGQNYQVTPAVWTGTTPLKAFNLNKMQDNIEEAINGVVESGSNANGSYIKFTDGTMICTGTGQCPANVGYAEITFANNFIDNNYIMIANHKYQSGSDYGGSRQLRNITNPQTNTANTAYIYSYQYDGSIANYIRNVQYVAIGRWK